MLHGIDPFAGLCRGAFTMVDGVDASLTVLDGIDAFARLRSG